MKKVMLMAAWLFAALPLLKAHSANDDPQPELGKPLPDFTLNEISNYKSKTARLADFKGKWLFLDFWGINCSACVKRMPSMDSLQKKLGGAMQVMLVGLTLEKEAPRSKVMPFYEKLREKYKFDLPSAYDSTLFSQWGIRSVPTYIIADPQGIVRFFGFAEMDEQLVKKIMDGSYEHAGLGTREERPEFDREKLPGSENGSLVYRSILLRGKGERTSGVMDIRDFLNWAPEHRKHGLSVTMQPLAELYQLAYFGYLDETRLLNEEGIAYRPVIETKDSALFKYDYQTKDFKGLYNYNLALPDVKPADYEYVKKVFQNTLKDVFRFDVSFEKRKVAVWTLVAQPGAAENLKVKDPAKKSEVIVPYFDMAFYNIPISRLMDFICYSQDGIPILDETGIKHNIDIRMQGHAQNLEDVKAALRKNGLDLVLKKKEMKVLVIKDPKPGM